MIPLTRIAVPLNWTAERDVEYLEDRWGSEGKDHGEALRWALQSHCGGLVKIINASVAYFYDHDLTLSPFPLDCVGVTEKIAMIEIAVARIVREPEYHRRFREDLALCRWAESERRRVFSEHTRCHGNGWLYPVMAAIDLCGAAAFELELLMESEHDDFAAWAPDPGD
jgi:hypothetical protein